MTALICGSAAYDNIMVFEDSFKNHILPDKIHILNVAFLVPRLRREFGGCATNIAYNLKLLGGNPLPMATVTRNSAVNAFGPTTLATSAVIESATAEPSDSPIESAALLKPCDDTGESFSTATENRGYMMPIAPPAIVQATNAIAGASVSADTSSTTTSAAASTLAPSCTACVFDIRSPRRPWSHDPAAHVTPAPVSTAPARLGENS